MTRFSMLALITRSKGIHGLFSYFYNRNHKNSKTHE